MPRILIRAGKDPRTVLSHEQSLAVSRLGVFGSNSGNMLFYSAVHRTLSVPGTELVPDAYFFERPSATAKHVRKVNEEYDRVVLPMANSYRDTFLPHLERLAWMTEQLTIPVNVIGIGAQLPYGTKFDTLPDEYVRVVKRFTAAVLDKSPSIGVRGEYTADMLRHLGFPAEGIRVIGCPSMFGNGQLGPLERRTERLDATSPIAISYTPKVKGVDKLVNTNAARYPLSVVVPQQHHRLALMLWGENPNSFNRRMPIHTDHPLYVEDRMRFFVDAKPWIDFMATQHFAFGTRIHGNVAGVLAGTPSVVLAHDSRTVELSKYHGIPWRLYAEERPDIDAQELYDGVDFDEFAARQPITFATYLDFLAHNELENVFTPGHENPEYDEAVAKAKFPGAVHTLMADGEEGRRQVMERLRWLRQGHTGDQHRTQLPVERSFGGQGSPETLESLARRVTRLERARREPAPAATAPTRGGLAAAVRRPGQWLRDRRSAR